MHMRKISIILILIILFSFGYTQDYWESIYSSEEPIYRIEGNSENVLFLGKLGGLYKSIDSGYTWENILSNGGRYFEIDYNDNLYCSPPPMFFSSNYGDNWLSLNYPGLEISYIFSDSQNNIFSGFLGGIYKSGDNGLNWVLVLSLSSSEVVNSIVENSNGELFAGTTNFTGGGGVYRSLDNGDNWEFIGLEYEYISSLSINSNGEIFAGSRGQHYEYGGGIFRFSENGDIWMELKDDVLVTSIAIDSEDKIFIGCSDLDGASGAVQVSDNNGVNWYIIESEIMTPDIGIEFLTISDEDYVYAISYESINQIYRSSQPTTEIEHLELQTTNYELRNYPNPFNPITTISFDLPVNEKNPVIEIFNIKGEKIREYSICNKESTIVWDGTDNYLRPVSSGIYLYRIRSDEGMIMSNKMLLLK